MSRKREKPYLSRQAPSSIAKRRRPLPPPLPHPAAQDVPSAKHSSPASVLVIGLSSDCSVLDLKSRFEIYGCISRIRIDRDGVGYITFRSKESAASAIAASLDPSFGITVDSKRVQVLLANDPHSAVGIDSNKGNGSSSKLLRGEVPLRRHGRSNKLGSSGLNSRSGAVSSLSLQCEGREIVAYDDIL